MLLFLFVIVCTFGNSFDCGKFEKLNLHTLNLTLYFDFV